MGVNVHIMNKAISARRRNAERFHTSTRLSTGAMQARIRMRKGGDAKWATWSALIHDEKVAS